MESRGSWGRRGALAIFFHTFGQLFSKFPLLKMLFDRDNLRENSEGVYISHKHLDFSKIAQRILYILLNWRPLSSEALWLQIRSRSKEYLQSSRLNGSWFGNVHQPHAEMTGLQDAGWEGNKYGLWIFWAPISKRTCCRRIGKAIVREKIPLVC